MRAVRGLLVLMLPLTACTAVDGGGGGDAEALCAYLVRYEGRDYLGTADGGFEVGERIGTATVPSCDDTPNDGESGSPEETLNAYRVVGRDPGTAIAVGKAPDDVVLADLRTR
ncbi:DUF6281 family protein [Streptomyces sp. NPDC001595]|uniref:DUF6281 family protein n=1 Tax=Streptomyces sp. NPDC001532 TaxID=3154520 RepID=UPI003323A0CE